jgi:dienelactone hydrolase
MLILIPLLFLVTQACGAIASIMVSYRVGAADGQALLCRPEGKGPFPVVVYNHGLIVDNAGYQRAARQGYNLAGICQALAADGFLAFAPIRQSGPRNIPSHKEEVMRAVDYAKGLADGDPSRMALMGFSRGGLLTLMVGVERSDLKALVILAPAPGGKADFEMAVERVALISAAVLLLAEAGDEGDILRNFHLLDQALKTHGKEQRSVLYNRGGGHRLFYDVGYYWDDVRKFLREKLRAP